MEVGYLEYSEASALGGQVLDENFSHSRPINIIMQCPMLRECLMQA